jgi:hypothetical protein
VSAAGADQTLPPLSPKAKEAALGDRLWDLSVGLVGRKSGSARQPADAKAAAIERANALLLLLA